MIAGRISLGRVLDESPSEANYRYALGLAAYAAPLAEVPEGYWDFIADMCSSV